MLTPISNSGAAKIDAQRVASSPLAPVDDNGNRKTGETTNTPAARFAKLGPPIDLTRVNEVRAAIASGSYTIDADRLAVAMMAIDLPAQRT